MFARPPTNLPGKTVKNPIRPNSIVCPDCNEIIEEPKIKDGKTRCPNCNTKIKVPSKKH